jgi:two-component system chemotaxis sensor kinase CheA
MAKKKEKSVWLLRFLSSGKFDNPRDDTIMEEMIRYVIYNSALILGSAFLVIYGFTVLARGNTVQGILDMTLGAYCFIVIFLLRTKLSFNVCGLLVMIPFGLFCAFLLWSGGERGFASLWIFTYPLLAIFILGLYTGTILSGFLLVAIFACTMIPGFANYNYSAGIAASRLVGVFMMVLILTIVYEQVRIIKERWVRQLRIALQKERDEIAAMKDNLQVGLFLMNKDYVIQGAYSKALEDILGTDELEGVKLTNLLSSSIKAKERDTLEDYFNMVLNRSFDTKMLEDINPISEFAYTVEHSNEEKTLRSSFTTVDRGHGEYFILGTLEDVTAAKLLEQQLAQETARREEEMRALFQVIQVEPRVFGDFIEDTEYEFNRINDTLKTKELSAQEVMVDIYQSIHAIKSNSLILGLDNFGDKLHRLESQIKEIRDKGDIGFEDMLHITVEIEKIMKEKDKFRDTIGKIESFHAAAGGSRRQDRYVLVETLTKACEKAAAALDKKVKFIVDELDGVVLERGPRRIIKEVLTQLVRNSVYHGIEAPAERTSRGKNSAGTIRLSIKCEDNKIHIKLSDDGRGLNFDKIREKALELHILQKEDADDKNHLLQAIFAPGFSTADGTDMHAGRGIGLNLVRERIKDLHGSIKLQTEPEKGTVFNLFIPLEKAAAAKTS